MNNHPGGLEETVLRIISMEYDKDGKPVSWLVLAAALGRMRVESEDIYAAAGLLEKQGRISASREGFIPAR